MRVKEIRDEVSRLFPALQVFAYNMPVDIKRGVLVVANMPADIHQDIYGYRIGEFTIVVRDSDYESGIDIATQISSALTGEGLTISGVYFMFIRAKHEPMVFPRSEGNGLEFSVSFQCRFVT